MASRRPHPRAPRRPRPGAEGIPAEFPRRRGCHAAGRGDRGGAVERRRRHCDPLARRSSRRAIRRNARATARSSSESPSAPVDGHGTRNRTRPDDWQKRGSPGTETPEARTEPPVHGSERCGSTKQALPPCGTAGSNERRRPPTRSHRSRRRSLRHASGGHGTKRTRNGTDRHGRPTRSKLESPRAPQSAEGSKTES